MNKYIITEEQLERLGRVHLLLAREIKQNTMYQSVNDSVDLAVHLDEIAKQLIINKTKNYELKVTGGKFVWKRDYENVKIGKGCEVMMKKSSGCDGWGNIQCINDVIWPLDEITLYGHNQAYKIYDIEKIISYPKE